MSALPASSRFRTVRVVDRLLGLLRSLGTAGAVANVWAVLDRDRHETALVDALAARLESAGDATFEQAPSTPVPHAA